MLLGNLLKSGLKKATSCSGYPAMRFISTSSSRHGFYEADTKSGYEKIDPTTLTNKAKHAKTGFKQLKHEVKLWKEEVVEKFRDDPAILLEPGSVEVLWKFDNLSVLDKWVTTCDKDHNEGFSEVNLTINKHRKALFHGMLRTDLPKDGKVKKAGYCNMRSMRPRRSFQRDSFHDWLLYTHLLMRVRGDGRSYLLNLSCCGDWDILWNDIYSFVLYTRGGPYWQIAKIPFSRFFLASKGRVQDKQSPLPLDRITNFGISCADKIPGPFHLEMDYIGIQFDPTHTEETAYEMYQVPKFIVGS